MADTSEKILVNKEALKDLLMAFHGPMYLVNELWAIKHFPTSPVAILFKDFKDACESDSTNKSEDSPV